VNANWIIELPFGKGRWIGGGVNWVADAFIGGWQLSGLADGRLVFATGASNGGAVADELGISGYATQVGAAPTHGAVKNPGGNVNLFGDSAAVAQALGAFQPDLPRQVGNRNNLARRRICRPGPRVSANIGRCLWKESHSLQFRWKSSTPST